MHTQRTVPEEYASLVESGLLNLGPGTVIERGTVLRTDTSERPINLGNGSLVRSHAVVCGGVTLGDGCIVEHGVALGEGAVLGRGSVVEHGSTIGPGVAIGDDCRVWPNSVISGAVSIGNRNELGPLITIGTPPQHLRQRRSKGRIEIGDDNVIREYVTVHLPTGDVTRVGNHCYIMAYNHLPHDVTVEDHVTLANNCQIAGHSRIMHHANLGLCCVLHQHSAIGAGAMVGMGSAVHRDVPPYVTYVGSSARSMNRVGMERMGLTGDQIDDLQNWYAEANVVRDGAAALSGFEERWWHDDLRSFFEASSRRTCTVSIPPGLPA